MKTITTHLRKGIHWLLTSIIAMLGITSCGYMVKYGVPGDIEPGYIDTSYICMYGVYYTTYSDDATNEDEPNGDADTTENND